MSSMAITPVNEQPDWLVILKEFFPKSIHVGTGLMCGSEIRLVPIRVAADYYDLVKTASIKYPFSSSVE